MSDDFDFSEAERQAAGMWEDRGDGYDPAVDPDQLMGHPMNAKIHPRNQQKSMVAILARLGWVQDVIVNRVTGRIIDGHMRVRIALNLNKTVPVKYVRLSEEEEREVLATFDPVGDLAIVDEGMYEDLVEGFEDPGPEFERIFDAVIPKKVDPRDGMGSEGGTEPSDFGDVIYGMVGWSETKIRSSSEEIEGLTIAHSKYRAENGGDDDGFIKWLLTRSPND